MRVLITGANGMLGSDLVDALIGAHDVYGLGIEPSWREDVSYAQADITDRKRLTDAVRNVCPQVLIHAAAHTAVDSCEEHPKLAFLVNTQGSGFVAEAANEVGATLLFISTDYVFDGRKKGAYVEDDAPQPLSVYGESKLRAENVIRDRARSAFVVRASWLYGASGKNFFQSIYRKITSGGPLRVVNDQRGAPTYTKDLAQALKVMIEKGAGRSGVHIYHVVNGGVATWYEAACRLVELTGLKCHVHAITSSDLDLPARRPENSELSAAKVERDFGISLRRWDLALEDFWHHHLKAEQIT